MYTYIHIIWGCYYESRGCVMIVNWIYGWITIFVRQPGAGGGRHISPTLYLTHTKNEQNQQFNFADALVECECAHAQLKCRQEGHKFTIIFRFLFALHMSTLNVRGIAWSFSYISTLPLCNQPSNQLLKTHIAVIKCRLWTFSTQMSLNGLLLFRIHLSFPTCDCAPSLSLYVRFMWKVRQCLFCACVPFEVIFCLSCSAHDLPSAQSKLARWICVVWCGAS